MRAIDADAFAEYLKDAVKRQKYEGIKIDGLLTVADVIEAIISELDGTSLAGFKNAPTIEPERKKGKWQITDAYPHNVYCSECHTRFAQTHWAVWEDGSLPRNFCPNCGADMRGDENDQSK